MSDYGQDTYKYDPQYHQFCDILGVSKTDRDSYEVAKKLGALYDWASLDTGKKDLESVSRRVEQLRKDSGLQVIGKDLITQLYGKIRLHLDRVAEANEEFKKLVKQAENNHQPIPDPKPDIAEKYQLNQQEINI